MKDVLTITNISDLTGVYVKVKGKGHQSPYKNGENGDIIAFITIDDPQGKLKQDDDGSITISHPYNVTLSDAILGMYIKHKHFLGDTIEIEIPNGVVHNQEIQLVTHNINNVKVKEVLNIKIMMPKIV